MAFVTHVSRREVAVFIVSVLTDARRDDLIPAIQISNLPRVASQILQLAEAHHAEIFGSCQRPGKPQSKMLVYFFKNDAGAKLTLVKVPGNAIRSRSALPWFPNLSSVGCLDEKSTSR